jgi:hypothetical protein
MATGQSSAATLPACTTTSHTTCAATLDMTSGSFGVHGNAPADIPGPASITGDLDPATGAISGATLSKLVYHESGPIATTSTETIIITQTTPGAGTGAVNYLGNVSYNAALQILITIHSPVKEQCTASPVSVVLASSAPYTSGAVTISQANFTIPDFSLTHCGLAASELNERYSGNVNEMSLSLEGALPLPPPPSKPTTTSLTTPSPAGPVFVGTKVRLTAVVAATVGSTPVPTGHVTFKSGPTILGTAALAATGKATLTTTVLPAKPTQQLTAVYSGNTKYSPSTSPAKSYSVQPKPSVSSNLPVTVITGASSPTYFTVRLTNPETGRSFSFLKLGIVLSGIEFQQHRNITMTYENSAGTWCPLPLRNATTMYGTFKGLTGACGSTTHFPLLAGTSLTIHFRISYAVAANPGVQTAFFLLETVTPTSGKVIPPFTTTRTTGIPTNAPYVATNLLVHPATKYPVTLATNPISTSIPQGFTLAPQVAINGPANTTTRTISFPVPTGTMKYQVTGVTVTPVFPAVWTTPRPIILENTRISTSGLSVGTHILKAEYSGDGVYNGATVTLAFTVVAAAPGTVYSCTRAGRPIAGSVVVSGTVPLTSPAGVGAARVSLINLTVNLDNALATAAGVEATDVQVNLLPGGTITAPTTIVSTANDTATAKWTGLSGTVPVTGNPGSQVTVGIASVSFTVGGTIFNCTAGSPAAIIGTILISGVTLTASPASPVPSGTNVTLTATAVPATRGGQVSFLTYTPGLGKTVTLGTAQVPTSGATKGIARLGGVTPTVGHHSYSAEWSGTVPVSTSNVVPYTVETIPTVTKQPAAATVKEGTTASFTATSSGTPTPTAQWQVSTNGTTWATIAGATGTTYTTPATTAVDSGNQYRAVFTNGVGSATTTAASLTVVVPPSVTTQPANQSVVAGSTASFTAKAAGSVPSVQWQISTDEGKSWSDAPGTPTNTFASRTTITSTYTTPATTTSDNGDQYRAHFSNAAGTTTSDPATLTVAPAPVAPTVTTQPKSVTVNVGSSASFSAAASGVPSPSVQWQVSSNGGGSWSAIPGATSSTLSLSSVPGTAAGNQYRAVFTNSAGTSASNTATLTVNVLGYRLVASNGAVFSYGGASFHGSMGGQTLNAPIVGTASTAGDGGYWLVGSDGGIFAFGNAQFYGSMGGKPLNKPIVGMTATPTGQGYWEVASDGGIFAFGNAQFYGSMGGKPLNKPIVAMSSTPDGKGYWEVASDGGIFAFGDAQFYGSTGAMTLNKPIVGMATASGGQGYWLVASDGGIFSFGSAPFYGTVASSGSQTIAAMLPTPTGGGYWEVAQSGQVFQFGNATSAGTALTQTTTIVAMSS